jgi:hypothetical protein
MAAVEISSVFFSCYKKVLLADLPVPPVFEAIFLPPDHRYGAPGHGRAGR